MARGTEFSPELQGPSNDLGTSLGTVDSTASAVGAGLSGLARILDVGLRYKDEQMMKGVTSELETKLRDEVSIFSESNSDTPALLNYGGPREGQSPENVDDGTDVWTAPHMQGVNRSLSSLQQGANQGRISREEFYLRSAGVVQQAIKDNPRFADQIRQRAQDVLGVLPSQQLVAMETQRQAAMEGTQQQLLQDNLQYANENAILYLTDDGNEVDLYRTQTAVRLHREASARLEAEVDSLDRNIKRDTLTNRTPSQLEYERVITPITDDMFHSMMSASMTQISQWAENNGISGDGGAQELAAAVGDRRLTFMATLERLFAESEVTIPTEVRGKIKDHYSAQFEDVESWANGGLSRFQQSGKQIEAIANADKSSFSRVAPIYNALGNVFGFEALADIWNDAMLGGGLIQNTLAREMVGFSEGVSRGEFGSSGIGGLGRSARSGIKSNMDILSALDDLAVGRINIDNLITDMDVALMLPPVISGYTTLVGQYEDLTDPQVTALTNFSLSIVGGALRSGEPDDFQAAIKHINKPSTQAFIASRVNDGDERGTVLANAVMNLNVESVNSQMRLLKQEQTVYPQVYPTGVSGGIVNMARQDAEYQFTHGGGFDGLGSATSIVYSTQWNPETGLVEIVARDEKTRDRLDPNANPIVREYAPKDMVDAINSINSSMFSSEKLLPYTGGEMGAMDPNLYKQNLIRSAGGLPLRPGTQYSSPPQPQANRPSSNTPTESGLPQRVDSTIRAFALQEGVDPDLAVALAGAGERSQDRGGHDAVSLVDGNEYRSWFQMGSAAMSDVGLSGASSELDYIRGGVKYLKLLMDRYSGDIESALAAYNAGMRKVDEAGGVPPFPETIEYVRRVIEAYNPLHKFEDSALIEVIDDE